MIIENWKRIWLKPISQFHRLNVCGAYIVTVQVTLIALTPTETWDPMLELLPKSTSRLHKQYVYKNTNGIRFEELGRWILYKNHTHMLDHFHICSLKMSCCRTVNQSDSHIETRIRIAILRWPAQSTEIPKLKLIENGRNMDKHCTFILSHMSHLIGLSTVCESFGTTCEPFGTE